jgi:polyisoprenoid-binding protein YceI
VNVDVARSQITVKVEKSGLFSAFAHNHTIRAAIASGKLDTEKRTATLTFDAKEMKVLDEGVKDSERAEIEQTMKSDRVLDVQRFPEIRFVSRSITPQDGARFQVRGDLTLHGATRSVEFPLTFSNDRYTGSVKLKQTDFGIAPVSIAGGAIKVKDVIDVILEIVPGEK